MIELHIIPSWQLGSHVSDQLQCEEVRVPNKKLWQLGLHCSVVRHEAEVGDVCLLVARTT